MVVFVVNFNLPELPHLLLDIGFPISKEKLQFCVAESQSDIFKIAPLIPFQSLTKFPHSPCQSFTLTWANKGSGFNKNNIKKR